MSCCKQVFMPMRGGTHYFFLSLSLSLPPPHYLSLSLSFCVSLCISVSLCLSPSLAYQTSSITITSTIAEQRRAWEGRMTHSEMRHQGLTQPLETPSLRYPHQPSLSVFFHLPLANTHSSLEISNIRLCVCVCVCTHPFLDNFVGVFEDSDRLYPRRPSTAGVLALCLTPHTCCVL